MAAVLGFGSAASMPLSVRRVLASGVNVLLTIALALPFLTIFDDPLNQQLALVITFLAYNLVCEAAFGRCLGGAVAGLRWAGSPSLARRSAFCVLYTVAFVPYVFLPAWQAIPNLAAQWVWGRLVGGTIHSWLAGVASEANP